MGVRPKRFRVAAGVASLLALGLAAPSASSPPDPSRLAEPVQLAEYDLGVVELPADNPKGPLPVRLWGTIAAPADAGPHPVVLIAHGRHGDGCPEDGHDNFTWPCFDVEQRNDLGLAHAAAAIAARGTIAIVPDLNAAYTFGWGEPDERSRWQRIARRTLTELERDSAGAGERFGVALTGRADVGRLGLLGHSRSGMRAARGAERLGARSLFLLTPAEGGRLPDVPSVTVIASCDGDVGTEGRSYLSKAQGERRRSKPVVEITLRKANHNFFNSTLSDLDVDDSIGTGRVGCRDRHRLTAGEQQEWLDRAAADFFAAQLVGSANPRWLRAGTPRRLYGERVRVRRLADR